MDIPRRVSGVRLRFAVSVVVAVSLLLIAGLHGRHSAPVDVPLEKRHRLYDLAPISSSNPVVASVEGTDIAIPLSEYRAYLSSLPEADRHGTFSFTEKRRLL